MAHLILRSPQEHDAAHAKLLARYRRKIGKPNARGFGADYVIHVDASGKVPIYSAAHRDEAMFVGDEFDTYAGHVAEARKAMKRGKDYFVAVYFNATRGA